MEIIATILFILGALLEIAAFFGTQAKKVPPVLRFIAPKYVNSVKGLRFLESQNVLNPSEPGFQEIADIFINIVS